MGIIQGSVFLVWSVETILCAIILSFTSLLKLLVKVSKRHELNSVSFFSVKAIASVLYFKNKFEKKLTQDQLADAEMSNLLETSKLYYLLIWVK